MLPPTIIVIDIMINTLLIMMKISKKEILDMYLLRLTPPQSPQVSTQVAQFVRQCGFYHLYNALCGLQSGDVFKCDHPPSVFLLGLNSSRSICVPLISKYCTHAL